MDLRTEIVNTLRIREPLDDDQLPARLGRNRHYVNQVCRGLSEHGLARR